MWKAILKFLKASVPKRASLLTAFISVSSLYGQQYVIADKDVTRPASNRETNSPAKFFSFTAVKYDGYNEVEWSSLSEQDIRKYIIEYSNNGTDFHSAGEVFANKGAYTFKHHLADNLPALYRIKMELLNGKYFYSTGAILDGINISPVQIYPTIVQGNTVNVNAYWPVEKINIFSAGGQQVFSKDINGERDYMAIVIPSLGKGIYWMNFYGQGWKTTSKFIIQ